MNKKLLFKQIIIRLIHFALAVLLAALIAGLIAFIAAELTEDLEIIVISCLIGIWAAEVFLYAARSKVLYNERIKTIDEIDLSKLSKKKSSFKKRYVISAVIFSVVFGFVLYNMKDNIIHDITSDNSYNQFEESNDNILLLKIGIVVVLLAVLAIRMFIRKRSKNKIKNKTVEKDI